MRFYLFRVHSMNHIKEHFEGHFLIIERSLDRAIEALKLDYNYKKHIKDTDDVSIELSTPEELKSFWTTNVYMLNYDCYN